MAKSTVLTDLWHLRSMIDTLQNVQRPLFEARRYFQCPAERRMSFPCDGLEAGIWQGELEAPEKSTTISSEYGQLTFEKHVAMKPINQNGKGTSPFFIADLMIDQGDFPVVRFQHIRPSCKPPGDQYVVLQGFYYLRNGQLDECNIDSLYSKALDKGTKTTAKVARFLERAHVTGTEAGSCASAIKHESDFSQLGVDGAAMIGGPPCEGHARNVEGISSFHKMDFAFPTRSFDDGNTRITSSQLLHFSCPSLRVDDRLFASDGQSSYHRIDIVSGICLFNSSLIQRSQIINDGLEISWLSLKKLTLYEAEYIARASTAIADFATHIIVNDITYGIPETQDKKLAVCINLDVPSFHYYGAIHQLVIESKITSIEALQWLEVVVSRSEKLAEVFKLAVSNEMEARLESDHLPDNLNFSISPARSSVVWSSLQNALRNGHSPSIQDTMERLANECDDTWNIFLSLLPAKDYPQDFRSLGYTFYVYECVRPALRRTDNVERDATDMSQRPRQLLLSIDDSVERRVYSRAQKLLKDTRRSSMNLAYTDLIEAYLFRRVFINSNKTGSNLYLDDPSPEKPRLSELEEHSCYPSQAAMPSLPAGGSELDCFDIISALHGENYACRFRSLCAKVGLDG